MSDMHLVNLLFDTNRNGYVVETGVASLSPLAKSNSAEEFKKFYKLQLNDVHFMVFFK